jgi:putative SOS response-associated peptidase YedK
MRWGLIPSWASDAGIGARTINARAETAERKPSFRDPLRKQRCLIPADGFYEWQRAGRQKQPFCFEVGEGAVFAFAGLWDRWRGPSGEWVESCTILTTTPNPLLADVHDRMPAILPRERYESWLDPALHDAGRALALIGPFDAAQMRRYAVSMRVNRVSEDGPECSAPVELPPVAATLFD